MEDSEGSMAGSVVSTISYPFWKLGAIGASVTKGVVKGTIIGTAVPYAVTAVAGTAVTVAVGSVAGIPTMAAAGAVTATYGAYKIWSYVR